MKLRFIVALLCLNGCSNQQIYNAIRSNRINDCERYVDSAREECLRKVTDEYRVYEKRLADQKKP